MTDSDQELLKRLAAAYAFISDVRALSVQRGDTLLTRKTAGIEKDIEAMRKQYPHTFQRHFTAVKKRIRQAALKQQEKLKPESRKSTTLTPSIQRHRTKTKRHLDTLE